MTIADIVNELVDVCHGRAYDAGWWKNLKTGTPLKLTNDLVLARLMLVVSEISEAAEGQRKDLKDDHLPHRQMVEVELADAVIRICDLAGALKLDLGGAVMEKLEYNRRREDHKIQNRRAKGGKKI